MLALLAALFFLVALIVDVSRDFDTVSFFLLLGLLTLALSCSGYLRDRFGNRSKL